MSPSKRKKSVKRKSKSSDPCTQELKSFHLFPRLPPELRSQIYILALPPRIVTIDVAPCFKLAWHNINTYTGHKYPGPTPADRFNRSQRGEDEPVAAFERLYARSKAVALLSVSSESREHVLRRFEFAFDSYPNLVRWRDLTSNMEIFEDSHEKRGWGSGHYWYLEKPRFLVQKKELAHLCRVKLDVDIIFLDSKTRWLLFLAEKWLPRDFIKGIKRLALSFSQWRHECAADKNGTGVNCHKEFTGLEELIIFTGRDIEGAFSALGQRLPQSTAMIKHKVARLVQEDFEGLAQLAPEWKRPAVRVYTNRYYFERSGFR